MLASWKKKQERQTNWLVTSALLVLLLSFSATSGQTQLPPSPQRGFQPGGSFALSDIESINVANGNMMLNIPLASLPPGRGNSSGFGLTLNYNSKLYDTRIEEIPDEGTGQIIQQIHLNPSEQGGWHYNVSPYILQLLSRFDIEGGTSCSPGQCSCCNRNVYIYKLNVIFPDSGEPNFGRSAIPTLSATVISILIPTVCSGEQRATAKPAVISLRSRRQMPG